MSTQHEIAARSFESLQDFESVVGEPAASGTALLTSDGRIVSVDDATCELVGRDDDELVGLMWDEIVVSRGRRATFGAGLIPAGDERSEWVEWLWGSDGSIIEVDVTAHVAEDAGRSLVLLQINDRTDESQTRISLFAAEHRFSALAETSSDFVVWLGLLPELRVLGVNDAAIKASGFSAREFYDDPDLQQRIIHPDDWHLLQELVSDESDAGGAVLRCITRDGEIRWVEMTISILAKCGDSASELLCVGRDITDQVKSDRERDGIDVRRQALASLMEKDVSDLDLTLLLPEVTATISDILGVDLVVTQWACGPDDEAGRTTALRSTTQTMDAASVELVDHHAHRTRDVDDVSWLDESVTHPPNQVLSGSAMAFEITDGVAVPIHSAGRAVGTLAIYATANRRIDHADVVFLQVVVNTIEVLIERSARNRVPVAGSFTDRVTGLPDRAGLVKELDELLDSKRVAPVLLMLCDLDDFAELNETKGSVVGDEVLRIVANRLHSVHGGAVVARVGGDAFAFAIELSGARDAGVMMEMVLGVVSQPVTTSCGPLWLTMSTSDTIAEPGESPDAVIARTVTAIRDAKRGGRGQLRHATALGTKESYDRAELTHALPLAITSGAIHPHFQPIVSLPDEAVIGFEALARWERSDGSSVPPAVFIPLAEQTGHVLDIGDSILEGACAFLERVHELGGSPHTTVKVNVSIEQLFDPAFVGRVGAALKRHSLAGPGLCLELTESQAIHADPRIERALAQLKELNVGLAIDDFGTGYSNFAYLTQLPVDILKLDRSMITDLSSDPRRLAVVRAILVLCRKLGIEVIAEGVETEAERDTLIGLRCKFGQGFLWGRAVPLDSALALVDHCVLVNVASEALTARAPKVDDVTPVPTVTPERVSISDRVNPSPRTDVSARGCWGYLIVGATLLAAYYFAPHMPGAPAWFPHYPICVLINGSAVGAVVFGIRHWRPKPSLPWWLIAAGQLSYTIGDIIYYWGQDISHVYRFPGPADVFYLGRIPFIALGLALIIHYRGGPKRSALLDSAVIGLAAGAISWEFLIEPYTGANIGTLLRLTSLAYPVTDLMLLALAIRLLIGAGRRAPSFIFLTGGLVLLVVTDSIYGWDNLHDVLYSASSPIAGGWLLNYLTVGACALHPSMRGLTERSSGEASNYSGARLAALGAAALVCPVIVTVKIWSGHWHGDDVILVLSVVIICLIMVRLAEMMRLQERSETALRHESLHDPLTGLANRTLFYDRLTHALQRTRREARDIAVVLVDLDGFKQINDTRGHSSGDQVLATCARRLRACSRETDTVARLGGDEFAILIDGEASLTGSSVVAQRIVSALAVPIEFGEDDAVRVTGSVGVAIAVAGVTSGDQLFNEADAAMYTAKARHAAAGGFHVSGQAVLGATPAGSIAPSGRRQLDRMGRS